MRRAARYSHWLAAAAMAGAMPHQLAAQAVPGLPLGVLPGDGKLTCPQILAEAQLRQKEQDLLLEAADKIQVNPSAQTQALQALGSGLGMLFSALPGPLASLAGSAGYKASMESFTRDSRRAYADIEARQDFALERMDLMHGLYQRKCLGGMADLADEPAVPDPAIMAGLSGQMKAAMREQDVTKPGDAQLSCTQLNAEVASLQAQIEANKDMAGNAMMAHAQSEMNREKALSAATQAAGALGALIPGVGMVAGGAAKAAATAAAGAARIAHDPTKSAINAVQPIADRQAYATGRMQHVRELYMDKCIGGAGGK